MTNPTATVLEEGTLPEQPYPWYVEVDGKTYSVTLEATPYSDYGWNIASIGDEDENKFVTDSIEPEIRNAICKAIEGELSTRNPKPSLSGKSEA